MRRPVLWREADSLSKYLSRFRRCIIANKRKADIQLAAGRDGCIRVQRHQLSYRFFPASRLLEKFDQLPTGRGSFRQLVARPIFIHGALIVLDSSRRTFLTLGEMRTHPVENPVSRILL